MYKVTYNGASGRDSRNCENEDEVYEFVENNYCEEDYEELLNESCDMVAIGQYEYEPGRVLRLVDPVAFDCELNNYRDD